MRARNQRPVRLGDILRESVRSLGWEQRLREEDVVAGWAEAVGGRIAAHTRAARISGRRLTIVTESPVWTQQLSLLKPDILRRIAHRFGSEVVTELFFVTGEIPPPEQPAPQPRHDRAPAAVVPAELEREFADIPDEDVREAVRRLCRAALGRQGDATRP